MSPPLMLKRVFISVCLMALLHPHIGFAEDAIAPVGESEPIKQSEGAWQNIQDFEETRFFAIAGPPTQADSARAIAETKLYEDMVEHFDDLEGEDDDYLFIVEALFDRNDTDMPASLRNDDDIDDALNNRMDAPFSSSMYIDSVRPSFLPGTQIKPRPLEPENKDNADARSLFADILKPKADDILGDEIKPIIAIDPDKLAAEEAAKAEDKKQKAGNINAPPKQRAVSPDEETLSLLKQAVKELGLEKRFNLGSGVGGHQVLESNADQKAQASNAPVSEAAESDKAASNKSPASTVKRYDNTKKKALKSRKRARVKPKAPEEQPPPPPPKEESIFDIF